MKKLKRYLPSHILTPILIIVSVILLFYLNFISPNLIDHVLENIPADKSVLFIISFMAYLIVVLYLINFSKKRGDKLMPIFFASSLLGIPVIFGIFLIIGMLIRGFEKLSAYFGN